MQRHFLCHQQDILEAQPREFELTTGQASLSLFIVRYENELYAYQNRCPHLNIPLNWQPDDFLSLEQTHIQCSTHGALFNLNDGHCISGPCNGEALTSLPIELSEDGKIWIQS